MKIERGWLIAAALAGMLPGVVTGQRLADWPVRNSALPDALARGAVAAFWNPAGVGTDSARAQVLVVNLRSPEVIDLHGIAGAAAIQLERTTLAVAYEHIGISGFTRTDDSPGGSEAETFNLGENHFTLSASHTLSKAFTVGATARYARDDLDETDAVTGLGAGFRAELALPLTPRLAGYALSEGEDIVWGAAAELAVPAVPAPYALTLAYGVQADARAEGPVHRVAGQFEWMQRAAVSAGLSREPDLDGATWQPILAASLQFQRYALGIVRESLSNDFGATYTFRLQVGLGK